MFFRSDYECTQTIRDSIISTVVCEEKHVLKVFSDESAPQTVTKQRMSLVDTRSAESVPTGKI